MKNVFCLLLFALTKILYAQSDWVKENYNKTEYDIAMRDGDYAGAEDLLRQVEAAGVAPAQIRFERIALAYLRGQGADAVVQLKDLLAQDKGNVRGWALLAMLTSEWTAPERTEDSRKRSAFGADALLGFAAISRSPPPSESQESRRRSKFRLRCLRSAQSRCSTGSEREG